MESLLIAPIPILLLGKETVPLETDNPLEQVNVPLSMVDGRVTVPVKVVLFIFAF
jgi:hypothetical protein